MNSERKQPATGETPVLQTSNAFNRETDLSQYPPVYPSGPVPYQVPGQSWNPLDELLIPARRAGTLMMVIGSLVLICGFCIGVVGLAWDQLMQMAAADPKQQVAVAQIQALYGANAQSQFLYAGAATVIVGLIYMILGFFVRRGGKGATYTAMVLAILALLWLGLDILGVVLMAGRMPPAQVIGGACIIVVIALGNLIVMIWLVSAARNIRRIRELKEYQQNYLLYAQQQQAAYQQQAYGQGAWMGYAQQQQPPQPGQQPPQYPNWPPPPPQA